MYIPPMFFRRYLCSNFILCALLAPLTLGGLPFSAEARGRGQLVLASFDEDPALRNRLTSLSPTVNPEEARTVTYIAIRQEENWPRNGR